MSRYNLTGYNQASTTYKPVLSGGGNPKYNVTGYNQGGQSPEPPIVQLSGYTEPRFNTAPFNLPEPNYKYIRFYREFIGSIRAIVGPAVPIEIYRIDISAAMVIPRVQVYFVIRFTRLDKYKLFLFATVIVRAQTIIDRLIKGRLSAVVQVGKLMYDIRKTHSVMIAGTFEVFERLYTSDGETYRVITMQTGRAVARLGKLMYNIRKEAGARIGIGSRFTDRVHLGKLMYNIDREHSVVLVGNITAGFSEIAIMMVNTLIPPGATIHIASDRFLMTINEENILHAHRGDWIFLYRDTDQIVVFPNRWGITTGNIPYEDFVGKLEGSIQYDVRYI